MAHEEEKTKQLQEVLTMIFNCAILILDFVVGFKSSESWGWECTSTKNWKGWKKSQRKTDSKETLKKGWA